MTNCEYIEKVLRKVSSFGKKLLNFHVKFAKQYVVQLLDEFKIIKE